jgi:hypothetical protein
MIGLTKSPASRSQSSLSQFFQAPPFHWSRSIPCSLSLSWMSCGIWILSSPPVVAEADASPPAFASSPESQAVAVRASAVARPTAASTGEGPRRVLLPRRAAKSGRMDRMV